MDLTSFIQFSLYRSNYLPFHPACFPHFSLYSCTVAPWCHCFQCFVTILCAALFCLLQASCHFMLCFLSNIVWTNIQLSLKWKILFSFVVTKLYPIFSYLSTSFFKFSLNIFGGDILPEYSVFSESTYTSRCQRCQYYFRHGLSTPASIKGLPFIVCFYKKDYRSLFPEHKLLRTWVEKRIQPLTFSAAVTYQSPCPARKTDSADSYRRNILINRSFFPL